MKIGVLISRILLGLLFFVFGLNGILHFMPTPPMDEPWSLRRLLRSGGWTA